MDLTSWLKKNIIQPVISTVSSWLTPTATKKATTPAYTPTPYKYTPPTTSAFKSAVASPSTTYSLIAPTTKKAATKKTSAFDTISSWLGGGQPAQLGPGVAEKAMDYFLSNPLNPKTQAWAQTLPQGSANDTIRRQLQINALQQQLAGYTAEGQALKSLFPIMPRNAQGELMPEKTYMSSPFGNMQNVYSWLAGQFPDMYSPQGEIAGRALAGTPEYWQKSAKDVIGQSQAGQSLLNTIQNWMGKGGQAAERAGQAFLESPFGATLGGAAQAQGPEGTPTAPKARTITPEEIKASTFTAMPKTVPYEEVTPSLENKYWWQGGTQTGPPTPEQFNTPDYIQGYYKTLLDPEAHPELYDGNSLSKEGEKAAESFWDDLTSDAKDGYYTPEMIGQDPETHEIVAAEMLLRDKYDQKWVETLQDASLGKVITQVASQDPTKLPPEISQERLDAMERGPDFATLYDIGYRSQVYQDEASAIVQQIQSAGADITYDPEVLDTLTYANIEGLKQELTQLSPAEWQQIIENGGQITLKTEFWKFNAKGEPINRGSWDINYPPQSAMTQSEKDRYIDQQKFYNEWYWSEEATLQRQKEREESYEYYQEKELEGWKEYYAALDAMKLYPDANDYWSQPGKFEELRRKWETSDSGLSWEDWLKQYDFEGEWYKKPPEERGERPYLYNPRMIRLNY